MKVDTYIGADAIMIGIEDGDDYRQGEHGSCLCMTPEQALTLAKQLQDEVRYYRELDDSLNKWCEGRPSPSPLIPVHRRERDCMDCVLHAGCNYVEGGCDGFERL